MDTIVQALLVMKGKIVQKKILKIAFPMIIVFASLSSVGVFGFIKFQNYQNNQVLKQQEYQGKLLASLAEIEALKQRSAENEQNAQKELQQVNQKIEQQSEQQKQILQEAQQTRLEAQQEAEKQTQLSNQKIKELEQKLSRSTYTLPEIIKEWSPIMARITCEFRYSDTDVLYETSSGSGLVIMDSSMFAPRVITNKHVVVDDSGYYPKTCSVIVSGIFQIYHFYTENINPNSSMDFAWATIMDSDITLRNASITYSQKSLCTIKPDLGDSIAILGYPSIGSQYSITATEGIVSGYDGKYFITSAKVERGNSGGAAILVKNNCLLGIPTLVKVGGIESLARILDINTVLQ